MPLDDFQSEVLRLLGEHEQLISQLYNAYADNFIEHSGFWCSIAKEEVMHAEMLRTLRGNIREGDAHFSKNSFPLKGIMFSMESVKKAIADARSGNVTPIAALALAKDYENSLIEKDYFKVVEADSDEVKETMLKLVEDGKRHRAKVETLLAKVLSERK